MNFTRISEADLEYPLDGQVKKQPCKEEKMEYLIVVDMQKDFVDGVLGTKMAQEIVPAAEAKIAGFQGKVLFTRDTHQKDYMDTQEGKNLPVPHCIKGSEGWEIIPKLRKYCKEPPVDKPSFGSMELAQRLLGEKEKVDSVTLIGVCTDICVISNAMLIKAALPEVPVYVDAACCAGVTKESHETALKAMKACQIYVINE